MKYLCLGYRDQKKMDARPKDEIDALMKSCDPYMEEFHKSDNLIIDAGLNWNTVSTVRTKRGKLTVSDGAFVETGERLGGLFIIEAKDLNEAILLASKHPAAMMGEEFGWGIEVRPVAIFQKEGPANAAGLSD